MQRMRSWLTTLSWWLWATPVVALTPLQPADLLQVDCGSFLVAPQPDGSERVWLVVDVDGRAYFRTAVGLQVRGPVPPLRAMAHPDRFTPGDRIDLDYRTGPDSLRVRFVITKACSAGTCPADYFRGQVTYQGVTRRQLTLVGWEGCLFPPAEERSTPPPQ